MAIPASIVDIVTKSTAEINTLMVEQHSVNEIDDRAQLVSDAIAFMQSIVHHYGEKKGMETFERLADHIDPNLKGEVFITMLTGQFTGRITLFRVHSDANAVACIKAIRAIDKRRLGLKEAKDIYDGLKYNQKPTTLEITADHRHTAAAELRAVGFEL